MRPNGIFLCRNKNLSRAYGESRFSSDKKLWFARAVKLGTLSFRKTTGIPLYSTIG